MARSGRGPSNVWRLAGERHFVAHGSTSRRKRGCLSLDLPDGGMTSLRLSASKINNSGRSKCDPIRNRVWRKTVGVSAASGSEGASEQDKQPRPDRTNASQGDDESQSSNSSGAEDHYGGFPRMGLPPTLGSRSIARQEGRATEPRQAGLGPFGSRSLPRRSWHAHPQPRT